MVFAKIAVCRHKRRILGEKWQKKRCSKNRTFAPLWIDPLFYYFRTPKNYTQKLISNHSQMYYSLNLSVQLFPHNY